MGKMFTLEYLCMVAAYSVLTVNTLEGSGVEQKRQHSLSNTYLSTHLGERASLTLFPQWATHQPNILN